MLMQTPPSPQSDSSHIKNKWKHVPFCKDSWDAFVSAMLLTVTGSINKVYQLYQLDKSQLDQN